MRKRTLLFFKLFLPFFASHNLHSPAMARMKSRALLPAEIDRIGKGLQTSFGKERVGTRAGLLKKA